MYPFEVYPSYESGVPSSLLLSSIPLFVCTKFVLETGSLMDIWFVNISLSL